MWTDPPPASTTVRSHHTQTLPSPKQHKKMPFDQKLSTATHLRHNEFHRCMRSYVPYVTPGRRTSEVTTDRHSIEIGAAPLCARAWVAASLVCWPVTMFTERRRRRRRRRRRKKMMMMMLMLVDDHNDDDSSLPFRIYIVPHSHMCVTEKNRLTDGHRHL